MKSLVAVQKPCLFILFSINGYYHKNTSNYGRCFSKIIETFVYKIHFLLHVSGISQDSCLLLDFLRSETTVKSREIPLV